MAFPFWLYQSSLVLGVEGIGWPKETSVQLGEKKPSTSNPWAQRIQAKRRPSASNGMGCNGEDDNCREVMVFGL